MAPPAIELQEVSKVFRLERIVSDGFKAFLVRLPRHLFHRQPPRSFVSLDRVSLRVERGETLGVIGRNGAGKTTLLSIVAGVMEPTSGSVRVRGRVSPLLGLGAGFAPELSGRTNILLNGILLGLLRGEVEDRMEEVIEFSGVRDFIDQPLKNFSAGMQARLGFAIALQATPDILLCDEILAVGDAEFQRKCEDRIAQMRSRGVTTLLATHSMESLCRWCDRAVLIDGGRVACEGPSASVAEAYCGLSPLSVA